MTQFINPNYHVILVHYPLGVFVLGVALELFGFLWRKSSVRLAARWMILLGGLSSLMVATSGIYALSIVKQMNPERYHYLKMHVLLTSIASLVAVLTVTFALGSSDRWRRKLHLPFLLLLVIAWGLFASGAWFAGETVYVQGTGVMIKKIGKIRVVETTVEEPATEPATTIPVAPVDTTPKTTPIEKALNEFRFYAGPTLQLHMIAAGAAFALAFGALGLSMRKLTSMYPDEPDFIEPLPGDSFGHPRAPTPEAADMMRSFSPAPEFAAPLIVEDSHLPAGRWWLLGTLVALIAAALGYWMWAEGRDTIGFNAFWEDLMTVGNKLAFTRSAMHVWFGVAIIVLSLVLAMLSRWAWRSPIALALLSLLLLLAIAGQVWVGILLQFDGPEGPLNKFTPEKAAATTQQPHVTLRWDPHHPFRC